MASAPATQRSKAPAKRSTPAKRTSGKQSPAKMFEALTEPDDMGEYDALIYGEKFRLHNDVNGFLLMLTGAGGADGLRAIVDLVKSLIVVEEVEGENIEVTREREKRRLYDLVGSQRHFGIEDAMEFVNSMTEVAAGNDL